jgi:hypothetical protein
MSDSTYWRNHRPGIVAPVLPWSVSHVREVVPDEDAVSL